jgi:hypothetical protein
MRIGSHDIRRSRKAGIAVYADAHERSDRCDFCAGAAPVDHGSC